MQRLYKNRRCSKLLGNWYYSEISAQLAEFTISNRQRAAGTGKLVAQWLLDENGKLYCQWVVDR